MFSTPHFFEKVFLSWRFSQGTLFVIVVHHFYHSTLLQKCRGQVLLEPKPKIRHSPLSLGSSDQGCFITPKPRFRRARAEQKTERQGKGKKKQKEYKNGHLQAIFVLSGPRLGWGSWSLVRIFFVPGSWSLVRIFFVPALEGDCALYEPDRLASPEHVNT